MSRKFKLLSLLLLLALVMTIAAGALAEQALPNMGGIPGDYIRVAQSSRFNLYLKQDTLAIIVESRQSGKLLYSTVQDPENHKDNATWQGFYQSGVVMEYIEDVKSKYAQADFINSPSEVTYDFIDNGFIAHVLFTDIEIGFDVEVRMDESGFTVKIPQDSIVEKNEEKYAVSSFYLYPFLGYTTLGENKGYMIIPDGQGALINLEDNEGRFASPFDRQVYGLNIGVDDTVHSTDNVAAEDIIMPVFGMVHTEDQIGFLGVIEQGDIAARIQAYPNGVRMNFDWICAKYTYRIVFNQPMGPSSGAVPMRTEKSRSFDIVQHFLLEDGESASYAGLAVAYRDYLIAQGTFEEAEEREFDVQLDFVGLERENFVLGKQDVVMTTFEQTGDILTELTGMGVENKSVVLRGWQDQGLTGGVPLDGYNPARSLGGKDGLEKLREQAALMGSILTLEADVLSLNTDTHPALTYSALKEITSQTWQSPTFGKVYDTLYYLTPTVSAEKAENVVRELEKNSIKGVSFTGITQLLADYYYKSKYHDTSEMAAIYAGIVDNANDVLTTVLTSPNAYLWRYADAVNDMPIGGSDYTYTDAEIPFLAISLSGQIPYYAEYVNFQANTQAFFLHLLEQGARPAFLLTWEDPIKLQNSNSAGIYSSRYELYADMIAAWYKDLSELHEIVGEDGVIMNHERAGEMVCVTWDNGTKVYINFGDKPASLDGVTLEKLSYKVVNSDG